MSKSGTTLYIANLNYKLETDDIKQMLAVYGKVTWVKIIMKDEQHKSGVAFAHMPNNDQAKMAIKKLNGLKHQGRTLKVSIANEAHQEHPKKGKEDFAEDNKPLKEKPQRTAQSKTKNQKKGLEALFSYLNKKK